MGKVGAWTAAVVVALAAACGPLRGPAKTVPPGFVRYGPDRDEVGYAERAPAAKRRLLRRINSDRRATGAPPLEYDLLAGKVGDSFCADAAAGNFSGHWDRAGRPPYLRWALAGGIDFTAENVGSVSRVGGGDIQEGEIGALLLFSHEQMMAERPPDDGHRRVILDPKWTHVGIGVAWAGGEFRMTEEFVRRVAEWIELPAGPLPAGSSATLRAKLPKGWSVGVIEVNFEPHPLPLTRKEVLRRGSYSLPKAYKQLYPLLTGPARYAGGGSGDFTVSHGLVTALIPLPDSPGSCFAVLYAEKGEASAGRTLWPIAVARFEVR
jgi:uncharacterized protein YkwD